MCWFPFWQGQFLGPGYYGCSLPKYWMTRSTGVDPSLFNARAVSALLKNFPQALHTERYLGVSPRSKLLFYTSVFLSVTLSEAASPQRDRSRDTIHASLRVFRGTMSSAGGIRGVRSRRCFYSRTCSHAVEGGAWPPAYPS